MPTEYTKRLQESPDMTLSEFIWGCARAFGAFISQRDDDAASQLILDERPSDYYAVRIVTLEQQLDAVRNATDAQLMAEQRQEVEAKNRWRLDAIRELEMCRENYSRMLEMVKAWQPPSDDHVELKKFMIKKIEESISFDCSSYSSVRPEMELPVSQYRYERIKALTKAIANAKKNHEDEVSCVDARNRWKRQLVDSIGVPPAAGR